jgi:hypothetical protein
VLAVVVMRAASGSFALLRMTALRAEVSAWRSDMPGPKPGYDDSKWQH